LVENRISLYKLEIFCKVAELGGVRRAAEALFISQPVVSEHLRDLQERMGSELFHREGRGIVLTEAGQQVHAWATEVVRSRYELDDALSNLAEGGRGSVRVGASMSVGNVLLTPVVIAFRKDHPKADVTLEMSPVEFVLDGVFGATFDFCVVPSSGSLDAATFQSQLVAEPAFSVVAPIDYDAVGDTVTPEQLSQLPFICPPKGRAIRVAQDFALASIGVSDRRVAIEVGSGESTKQAVAAGLGVALQWRLTVAKEIAAGVLREVPIEGVTLKDKLFVVVRRSRTLSPLQNALREQVCTQLPELVEAAERY
jgi:LysR family transcriptional regulator, low CO2-responsive transcriptional regulator